MAPGLRLLADDLTGALDTAAAFAPAHGSVRVIWQEAAAPSAPALAFDTGTRERDAATAAIRLARLAPFLAGGDAGTIRFFKVDSLLRGHAGRELLAVLSACNPAHVVIAPAIPFQRRITRSGRQMAFVRGNWSATGEDIAATLRAAGRIIALCKPGDSLPTGISLWDAATDTDLDSIVASAKGADNILWVGAAGLASALARTDGQSTGPTPLPPNPILGLIGTDHPVMQAQLAQTPKLHLAIDADADAAARAVMEKIATHGAAFVTCTLPADLSRPAIEAEIAARFTALAERLERPAGLFVSGGETLRGCATGLGATAIDCIGQFEPGAPISTLVGGRWNGMPLISKSGAFGTPDFLERLMAATAPEELT